MQASQSSSKTREAADGASRHASGHSSPRLTTELDVRIGVFRQPAMQTPVLVLNASYEPINICGARRALVLVLKGVARTEEEQGAVLHAARMKVAMPSVIRLLEYRRIPTRPARSRARTSCCATATPASTAASCSPPANSRSTTSSRARAEGCPPGRTWSPAATSCNRRKGNQLLHELTEMKLQREPRPFSLHTSRHIMRMIGSADPSWRRYLYFNPSRSFSSSRKCTSTFHLRGAAGAGGWLLFGCCFWSSGVLVIGDVLAVEDDSAGGAEALVVGIAHG